MAATTAPLDPRPPGLLRWALLPTLPGAWDIIQDPQWMANLRAVADDRGLAEDLGPALDRLDRAVRTLPNEGAWLLQHMGTFTGRPGELSLGITDLVATGHEERAAMLEELLGFYAAFGLTVPPAFEDAPDELGLALEFLYHVADQAMAAEAEGDDATAARLRTLWTRFLECHVGRCTAKLALLAEQRAEHDLFPSVAAVLDGFVQADLAEHGLEPLAPLDPDELFDPDAESDCDGDCEGCPGDGSREGSQCGLDGEDTEAVAAADGPEPPA